MKMKAAQLKKDIGRHFRIRPIPERWGQAGQRHLRDDPWSLDRVTRRHVKITNLSTGQSKELVLNNVRDYRRPDFLVLHCQLILRDHAVDIERVLSPKTMLDDQQEQLLEILAECQTKLGVPKLMLSRDGAKLFRPDKGSWRQVAGVNLGLELFGPQQPAAHGLVEFATIAESMPGEYLRRIPETISEDHLCVAVTLEGFDYLGLVPPAR